MSIIGQLRKDKVLVRRVLGGARVVFGLVALITPAANMRILAISPQDNLGADYLSRLFGTREIAVGALSSGVAGEATAITACRAGVVVDAIDIVSLLVAHRQKRVSTRAAVVLSVLGIAAVAVGAVAAED